MTLNDERVSNPLKRCEGEVAKERLGSIKKEVLGYFCYLEQTIMKVKEGFDYRQVSEDEYDVDVEYLNSFEDNKLNLKLKKGLSPFSDFEDTDSGSVWEYIQYQPFFDRLVKEHYRSGNRKQSLLSKKVLFSRCIRTMEKQGLLKLKYIKPKKTRKRVSAVKITPKAYRLMKKLYKK